MVIDSDFGDVSVFGTLSGGACSFMPFPKMALLASVALAPVSRKVAGQGFLSPDQILLGSRSAR